MKKILLNILCVVIIVLPFNVDAKGISLEEKIHESIISILGFEDISFSEIEDNYLLQDGDRISLILKIKEKVENYETDNIEKQEILLVIVKVINEYYQKLYPTEDGGVYYIDQQVPADGKSVEIQDYTKKLYKIYNNRKVFITDISHSSMEINDELQIYSRTKGFNGYSVELYSSSYIEGGLTGKIYTIAADNNGNYTTSILEKGLISFYKDAVIFNNYDLKICSLGGCTNIGDISEIHKFYDGTCSQERTEACLNRKISLIGDILSLEYYGEETNLIFKKIDLSKIDF